MPALLLHNGHCFDFVSRKVYRALLMQRGRIERLYQRTPRLPAISTLDLQKNYVIPGFIDSHTHLISRGVELQRVDLEGCRTLDECLEKLQSARHGRTMEIFGSNYDESSWSSFCPEELTRHTLDRISKKKPVIMRRICGHFAVVNTAALASISRTWTIVDRKHGYLYEDVALNLNDIFKPTADMLERAVVLGAQEAVSHGITSVHEIGGFSRLTLLQRFQQKQRLPIRFAVYVLNKYLPQILQAGLQSGRGNDRLMFAGVKVFLDGSLGARTAALNKPYPRTRKSGVLLMRAKQLAKIIKQADQSNLQLMVHSIGDRATKHALQAFSAAMQQNNPLRHRLEHLEVLNKGLVNTLSRLNIIASMQPNFVRRWQQPRGMYHEYLGDNYKTLNCFGALHRCGIKIIFGSDCMPMNPLYGLTGAFEHSSSCCRISMKTAYRMYTREPAFATFEEEEKGLLKPRFLADLVVLNKNPLETAEVDTINVLLVFIGGRLVYKNPKYRNMFVIQK